MVTKGVVFNIQRYSIQDGPGIRTTVFLKGCPLRCIWCSNPESQNPLPEVAHANSLCNKCGRCMEVCDMHAISVVDSRISINRKICNNCAKCVEACNLGAIKVYGNQVTVDEVFQEIRKDELYYRNSGGGVTASGGEPLSQPDFVAALFKRCQESGIHTCLDTSGYANHRTLEKVLEYTNLVLFDVKFISSTSHLKYTKVSNKQILRNIELITSTRVPLTVRVPLIPGINDNGEHIRDIAYFVVGLSQSIEVNILTYHRLGAAKYEMLDRQYKLSRLIPPSNEECQRVKETFESFGLDCKVVH